MSGLSPSASAVVREMAEIAAAPSRADSMEQMLALLRRVIPFQAAWLGSLDDEHHRYAGLAGTGYDERTRRYFDTPELLGQVDQCGLSSSPTPQCARDSPVPLDELPVWPEYYRPAGFRGGMGIGLFSRDRRHLGVLLLNTDDRKHPTDDARDLVGALAPRIAAVIDPIRSVAALALIVRDAVGGVALSRGGAALPLPGVPEHALLAPGSPLIPVAARQLALGGGGSFLWPARSSAGDDGQDELVRVVVLNCPAQPSHLVAVVVISAPPGGRPALTRPELALLGMLLEGWPDRRIAVAMDLPARAIAEMIERITAWLGASDRHTALLRAARRGWFIPYRYPGPPA